MLGSPDMAFEGDQVYDNCKIKTPKVSVIKNPNLSGWCEKFISLRIGTS